MRDINRIDNFLKLLGEEWKRQSPDLRFGQFFENNVGTQSIYHMEEHQILFEYFPNIPKREYITWGTRGKDGKQPVKRLYIKDLEIDHINAILKTQKQLGQEMIDIFNNELNYRRLLKVNKLLDK